MNESLNVYQTATGVTDWIGASGVDLDSVYVVWEPRSIPSFPKGSDGRNCTHDITPVLRHELCPKCPFPEKDFPPVIDLTHPVMLCDLPSRALEVIDPLLQGNSQAGTWLSWSHDLRLGQLPVQVRVPFVPQELAQWPFSTAHRKKKIRDRFFELPIMGDPQQLGLMHQNLWLRQRQIFADQSPTHHRELEKLLDSLAELKRNDHIHTKQSFMQLPRRQRQKMKNVVTQLNQKLEALHSSAVSNRQTLVDLITRFDATEHHDDDDDDDDDDHPPPSLNTKNLETLESLNPETTEEKGEHLDYSLRFFVGPDPPVTLEQARQIREQGFLSSHLMVTVYGERNVERMLRSIFCPALFCLVSSDNEKLTEEDQMKRFREERIKMFEMEFVRFEWFSVPDDPDSSLLMSIDMVPLHSMEKGHFFYVIGHLISPLDHAFFLRHEVSLSPSGEGPPTRLPLTLPPLRLPDCLCDSKLLLSSPCLNRKIIHFILNMSTLSLTEETLRGHSSQFFDEKSLPKFLRKNLHLLSTNSTSLVPRVLREKLQKLYPSNLTKEQQLKAESQDREKMCRKLSCPLPGGLPVFQSNRLTHLIWLL